MIAPQIMYENRTVHAIMILERGLKTELKLSERRIVLISFDNKEREIIIDNFKSERNSFQ